MNNDLQCCDAPVLEEWQFKTAESMHTVILPDGCQDLIVQCIQNDRPSWFLTSLDSTSRNIEIPEATWLRGFRLRPGVQVDAAKLLETVQNCDPHQQDITATVSECTILSPEVTEAIRVLECSNTVAEAAKRAAVTIRTFQRLVTSSTQRSPSFWIQLARVRRAARRLDDADSLAALACDSGFSDQAHMTRQFKRWFKVTPSQFATNNELRRCVTESGHG